MAAFKQGSHFYTVGTMNRDVQLDSLCYLLFSIASVKTHSMISYRFAQIYLLCEKYRKRSL